VPRQATTSVLEQECPHCGARIFAGSPIDKAAVRVVHNPQDCPQKTPPKEPGTAEGSARYG
jgi:hypothetical protein